MDLKSKNGDTPDLTKCYPKGYPKRTYPNFFGYQAFNELGAILSGVHGKRTGLYVINGLLESEDTMNKRLEQILLDFVTVYMHDRGDRPGDEHIRGELNRLLLETEVNSTLLLDETEYEE